MFKKVLTNMQSFDLLVKTFSDIQNGLLNRSRSLGSLVNVFVESRSYFYHDLGLSFLDNKVGEYGLAYMFDSVTPDSPSVNHASRVLRKLRRKVRCFLPSKGTNDPIYQDLISIRDLKGSMIRDIASTFASRISSYNYGTFTVHYPCEIGTVGYRKFFDFVGIFHDESLLVKCAVTLYNKFFKQYSVNDLASRHLLKGETKVCALGTTKRGRFEEVSPPANILVNKVTAVSTLTNQDNVLLEFSELLGLSLRMTEDQLTKNMLESSASVYRCSGGSNGDIPSNISLPDIQDVTSTLLSDNAWMMFSKQGGADKFGTGPVRNAFLALGHTDLSKDLDNLNDFLPKWNYPRDNGAVN